MSEIEKLYELAGVEYTTKCSGLIHCEDCEHSEESNCYNKYYAPFIAEKQLEITKFIGLRYGIKFIINEAMDYMLSTDLYYKNKFDKRGYGYGFDEAIANLTNNLWQNLTKKEKVEIRKILEG